MFYCLTFLQTTIMSVDQFNKKVYSETITSSPCTYDSYLNTTKTLTYYILREDKDLNATDLIIQDTPENINQLKANFSQVTFDGNITEENPVVFVQLQKSASYSQMSTFWVSFISILILVVFGTTALLIWHFDRYDLDPANALLFISEAHKDTSIINEH